MTKFLVDAFAGKKISHDQAVEECDATDVEKRLNAGLTKKLHAFKATKNENINQGRGTGNAGFMEVGEGFFERHC